ncbi:MAG: flagellar basal body-associated FliL family protein [Opitutaceae bacterium]|nr:flagellar basal body-associated FliL family protein [Opitutaceae bacterium]
MAAKTEAPPAAAAAPADAAAPKKSGGMMGTLIPVVVVIVLAPAISWAVAQFVIVPQLKKGLSAPADEAAHGEAAPAEHGGGEHAPAKAEKGGHGKKGESPAGAGNTYAFENVVVNLAGTMGTRYLKTSFLVTGADPTLRAQFEANKPRMLDVSLNVLSALTLSDLEEAGAKNIIREKLGAAYNQALGRKVAEQIYFSDFVVQ